MEPTDLSDFFRMLDGLPPAVQLFVLKLLATALIVIIASLSVKGLLLKIMGPPSPTDPEWRTKVYRALSWLDFFAANTATLETLLELARKEKVIRTLVVQTPTPEQFTAWSKTPSSPPPAEEPAAEGQP